MTAGIPFATRSSTGIKLKLGPPTFADVEQLSHIETKSCRTMLYSPDGKYFAYAESAKLVIILTDNWTIIATIEGVKPYHLSFSPKGNFLASWEQYMVTKDQPDGKSNLNIYESANGNLVKSFVQKKQTNWEPQWSSDEKICSRLVNNDIVFYEDLNFERIVTRINCVKVASYSISPNIDSYYIICHVPGTSGQPAIGKLFKYPNFTAEEAVASKSFFQCDQVEYYWNSKGNNVLLLTTTEVDKTGGSYYGKQSLHFIGINGQTFMVSMSKEGPIYSVAWSPKNHEFTVIYGFIPAKTTTFNLKCEPVFEFGAGARNAIYYNPPGNLILLGGFGNLRGHVEIWDAMSRKLIGSCEAPDSTQLKWCPDGVHFMTATTAPRLRISNGYKIWHYSGALLHEILLEPSAELYEFSWKSFPRYTYKEPIIKVEKVEGIASSQPVASKQAYRPPSARNRPIVNFSLDDDNDNNLPKTTEKISKYKKKRDAKKAKKLDGGDENGEEIPTVGKVSNIQISPTGDPDRDKKMKTIKKKLDAIEKLKDMQMQGKILEINQLAKIKAEGDLLKELQDLKI